MGEASASPRYAGPGAEQGGTVGGLKGGVEDEQGYPE